MEQDKYDYDRTLRLNLLEMMNYSKTIKNTKQYSDADLMLQLKSLYQFAKLKPCHEDLKKALEFLLKRDLLRSSKMGAIDVYSISQDGRETLRRILDGDDTVIY